MSARQLPDVRVFLDALASLDFETGSSMAPFDHELPAIVGWALHQQTATLALFAQAQEASETETWRDLLFALGGLRNDLRAGRDAAFGPPVVFALTDDAGAASLRGLVEELSRDYVLFTRLELNLLTVASMSDIDRALAPLLPRCRRVVQDQKTMGSEVFASLAARIRDEVVRHAAGFGAKQLGVELDQAAEEIGDRLSRVVAIEAENAAVVARPVESMHLKSFRSFADVTIPLKQFTLLTGGNGSGKSSIIEALEILWAGTSDRWPLDVDRETFDAHLRRGREEPYSIEAKLRDGEEIVGHLADGRPSPMLRRNIYFQDLGVDIALDAPGTRYARLLETTGLEIPELDAETLAVKEEAKAGLDALLIRFDMRPLGRRGNVALTHLKKEFENRGTASSLSIDRIEAAVRGVREVAVASGFEFQMPVDLHLPAQVIDASLWHSEFLETFEVPRAAVQGLRSLASAFEAQVRIASDFVRDLDRVLAEASRVNAPAAVRVESEAPQKERRPQTPITLSAAQAWLRVGEALRGAVQVLRPAAEKARDADWEARLLAFVEQAERLAESVPEAELVAMLPDPRTRNVPGGGVKGTGRARADREVAPLDRVLIERAGLLGSENADFTPPLVETLDELRSAVSEYVGDLRVATSSLLRDPLLSIAGNEAELRVALARYELARRVEKPIGEAAETLVRDLIGTAFGEIVSEIVAALTRFEWYFTPLRFDVEGEELSLGGMVNDDRELEIRMLLNAGERAIVNLAWFLSLFLLQARDRRRVLILDDAFSVLDANNQAAALSTLRTFVRLVRPELFVFSAHDEMFGESVLREMGVVAGWPDARAHLRLRRSADGASEVEVSQSTDVTGPNLSEEIRALGVRPSSPSGVSG